MKRFFLRELSCRQASLFLCLLTVAFSVLLASCGAADLNVAKGAYKAGDYATALAQWTELAEFGIPEAQTELGKLYAKGAGVEKDLDKAAFWLKKAAEAGYVRGMFELARVYEKRKEIDPAILWYRAAMKQGYPRAGHYLGKLYDQGKLVPADPAKALACYAFSAAKGYEKSSVRAEEIRKTLSPEAIAQSEAFAKTF